MPTRRIILAATLLLALPLTAQAQGKAVSIGKIISGNGLHIPTYIAMDRGYYKEEGLDAKFISLTGSGLIKGALSGAIDFIPIPSGGAQAALSGAEIRYVVGQSLASQWLIVTRPDINKPEDLKGKIIGYGRIGAADYDEGADVMRSAFKMEVGRDYKVISFQGEPERIAALVNGDIQGALISIPHAPKAVNAGMKILIRTAEHVPAGRRHDLGTQGLHRPESRCCREADPCPGQGDDVLPDRQGRLAAEPARASWHRQRQGRNPGVGPDPQPVCG